MEQHPRTLRRGRRRVELLSFVPLIDDGVLHWWNTVEKFGMSPKEYRHVLHEKAAYVRKTFLMNVQAFTRIQGNFLIFRVASDGVPLMLGDSPPDEVRQKQFKFR